MRLNGGYPAGVHAGTPEAPWNAKTSDAQFHCACCGKPGEAQDIVVTRKVGGVEKHLCAICAEDAGFTDCAVCGKWGGENDVFWCPDKRQHFHEECGKAAGLKRCDGCGDLFAEHLLSEWRGSMLCAECFGDVLGKARERERRWRDGNN
jgi:formylmethanofuran dehydrogenase subunit E